MLTGFLLIALAAISWGTTGSVTTILVAKAGADPLFIGVARAWIAAALLVPAALTVARPFHVAPRHRWRCLAMGVCMAGYQAAYFTAVTMAGITVAALVAICSAPLLIAALAVVFLGERLSARLVTALLLGIAGTCLLVLGPGTMVAPSGHFVSGVILALGAGAAYALYAVIAKATVASAPPIPIAAITFSVAAVLLTPTLPWSAAPGRQLALGWPWLVYLGAVTTAGAYAMYTIGLRWVPASIAGVITLLEPVTATALGVIVFRERLGIMASVGAALMFSALGVLVSGLRRERVSASGASDSPVVEPPAGDSPRA
jgi:DME family drug/metabolite transporter